MGRERVVFQQEIPMQVLGNRTTVRIDPTTEKGQRYLRLFEQARVQALERQRQASQFPAPAEPPTKPTTR